MNNNIFGLKMFRTETTVTMHFHIHSICPKYWVHIGHVVDKNRIYFGVQNESEFSARDSRNFGKELRKKRTHKVKDPDDKTHIGVGTEYIW